MFSFDQIFKILETISSACAAQKIVKILDFLVAYVMVENIDEICFLEDQRGVFLYHSVFMYLKVCPPIRTLIFFSYSYNWCQSILRNC